MPVGLLTYAIEIWGPTSFDSRKLFDGNSFNPKQHYDGNLHNSSISGPFRPGIL